MRGWRRVASRVADRLRSIGYEVVVWREPPSRPVVTDVCFRDLVPSLRSIGGFRLYRHQLEAFHALGGGENVVLTARTGSGKTEAWAIAALANDWRVLAVYPTLALSEDQLRRLTRYYSETGYRDGVVRVDRPSIAGYDRALVSRARVVATNPAFLLADLKRYAMGRGRSFLSGFLEQVDLVVFDELDFYGARSAHLALAMLEIISRHIAASPPRIAVLSATLGNPDELARVLSRITGRKTRLIAGNPFHVENYNVLVLGKNLDALRDFIERNRGVIASEAPWVIELLDDEDMLREHLYEVYEALEAIGLRPPRPDVDPFEVLEETLRVDDGRVTLVFARNIRMAERIYRGLLERLEPSERGLVAVHHHLVSKSERKRIEDRAREGRVRLIVTVRTLAQGIDIETIGRVIHVGLPLDLREFLQREGRKGRREELGYTETIILPSGFWDKRLLEAGASTLREWLQLPLEKVYINPSNAYAIVFLGLWKLIARRLDALTREELELLEKLGLIDYVTDPLGRKMPVPSRRGKGFWRDIGFYEHGPPYGFKRMVLRGHDYVAEAEEVSLRDVVEKYQPGFIDPLNDHVVVRVEPSEHRVYEEPLEEAVDRHEWLRKAVAVYENIKRGWGERPDIGGDLRYGRVQPSVVLLANPPREGFGVLYEEPLMVKWVVESRRPRLAQRRGAVRVYREIANVELESPVAGRYIDYTYGLTIEAPHQLRTDDVLLGLAMLMVMLRVLEDYALPLGFIRYSVSRLGPLRLIHLWEREAAGVLDTLDWLKLAKHLEEYRPSTIISVLLAAVDPEQALRVLRGEVSIEKAIQLAASIARAIAGARSLRIGGFTVEIPRRSRDHGVASVVVVEEQISDGTILVVDIYDGEEHSGLSVSGRIGVREALETAQRLAIMLDQLVSKGYTIYYYGEEQRHLLAKMLSQGYLANLMLREMERKRVLRNLATILEDKTGQQIPLTLVDEAGKDLVRAATRLQKTGDPEEQKRIVEGIARRLAEIVYDLALAVVKGQLVLNSDERA